MQVLYTDLEMALNWVSSSPEFDPEAFVARRTGQVFFRSANGPVEEDFPEDIDDEAVYVPVPDHNELDLGRDLVFRFVSEHAVDLEQPVHEVFRRKGAYARFKALLERHDLLDHWHAFERQATQTALTQWAADNGFAVEEARSDASADSPRAPSRP